MKIGLYNNSVLIIRKIVLKIIKSFKKTKVVYLPSNVEIPKISKINKQETIIGFIGDFGLRKGIHCLINAFEKSKSKNLLYLKLPKLDSKNKLFLNNCHKKEFIKIKGYYDSISDFYNEIDFLCIPSIDEGFGVVAIEIFYSIKFK